MICNLAAADCYGHMTGETEDNQERFKLRQWATWPKLSFSLTHILVVFKYIISVADILQTAQICGLSLNSEQLGK
jgi:hypothetical protein